MGDTENGKDCPVLTGDALMLFNIIGRSKCYRRDSFGAMECLINVEFHIF